MTNDDDVPKIEILLRQTPANHADTPPECDGACFLRWHDMPHPHLCPDGLMDDTPFLTITTWCSCGFRLQGPLRLDARYDRFGDATAAAGDEGIEAFKAHALEVHQVDVSNDEEWHRRLTTRPGE